MAGRVSHEAVETVDATVERSGPVDRPRVVVPATDGAAVPTDGLIRLVLDGSEYRARPVESSGEVAIPGAYDTPKAARNPSDATNRLAEWIEDRDLDYGRTVHLDVVDRGSRYGLRAPGERATYEDYSGPDDSLAAIAEQAERG
ncbi:MAG: hypothetical protein ABEJ68_03570 [Halobacteriaceae archaeon]